MTKRSDNLLSMECAVRGAASPQCAVSSGASAADSSPMMVKRASLRLLGCLLVVWTSNARAAGARPTEASARLTSGTTALAGSTDSKKDLIRNLWSGRVSAPDPNEDAKDRLTLMQLVRRVQSVKFQSPEPAAPAFVAPAEPQPAAAVAQAGSAVAPSVKPSESPASVPEAAHPTSLSAKAASSLEALQIDPGRARDPLEMAEMLFLSGRQAEAAPFYERALALTTAGDANTAADRAWILFQLGNCLRETDQARAKDTYMTLISEYPASPWTEIAKAHGQFITWYQKTKPRQLIAQRQP